MLCRESSLSICDVPISGVGVKQRCLRKFLRDFVLTFGLSECSMYTMIGPLLFLPLHKILPRGGTPGISLAQAGMFLPFLAPTPTAATIPQRSAFHPHTAAAAARVGGLAPSAATAPMFFPHAAAATTPYLLPASLRPATPAASPIYHVNGQAVQLQPIQTPTGIVHLAVPLKTAPTATILTPPPPTQVGLRVRAPTPRGRACVIHQDDAGGGGWVCLFAIFFFFFFVAEVFGCSHEFQIRSKIR